MPSETKTKSLYEKRLESLARYINSGKCRRIVLMLGAGVSTSAGIPDFRSPKTGLYANLARLKLPYPEAVFEISFFQGNPVPFYTLAHELYPGKYRPTPTHSFIRLLADKGLLSMCLTQNIDTLERRAGVPDHKIIEAHGSFAKQRCVRCQVPYNDEKMKEIVLNFEKDQKVPRCEEKGCGGLVKPDIVFFGEALPPEFGKAPSVIQNADLLIVLGTSLTVHPFASLASMTLRSTPRVLINLELVGDFEEDEDVVLLGKCDEVIQDLCHRLGWAEELDRAWKATASTLDEAEKEEVEESVEEAKVDTPMVEEEVEELAKKVEQCMGFKGVDAEEQKCGEDRPAPSNSDEGNDTTTEETKPDTDSKEELSPLPIQGEPLDVKKDTDAQTGGGHADSIEGEKENL